MHIIQENVRAARTSSNDNGKIYIVCLNLGRGGVAKRGVLEPTFT